MILPRDSKCVSGGYSLFQYSLNAAKKQTPTEARAKKRLIDNTDTVIPQPYYSTVSGSVLVAAWLPTAFCKLMAISDSNFSTLSGMSLPDASS